MLHYPRPAIAFFLLFCVVGVEGHGFMSIPKARNLNNGPKNGYCQHCGNGNTNVCGDGNQWPASSDYWKYTDGPTSIVPGGVLEIEIQITAHHKGHFEFSICDHQIDGGAASSNQDCLNNYLLERVPPSVTYGTDCLPNDARGDCQPLDELHKERFYLPPPGSGVGSSWSTGYNGYDVFRMHFYIPSELTCNGKCTLQWRWFTANSCTPKPDYGCYFDKMQREGWNSQQWCGSYCGTCQNVTSQPNTYQRGCGEEFANCADIVIAPSGPTPPPTPAPTPAPCGSCQGCQTPDGSTCYDDKSMIWCTQMKYNWCGTPPPTPAPTPPTPPPPTPAPAPTPPSSCQAIPGMNAGATDEYCAKCGQGYQWWPCNSQPAICYCDMSSTAPTPSPMQPNPTSAPSPTPPSPTPTPSDFCGSCTGCRFYSNNVCYTEAQGADEAYCQAFVNEGKAEWCGPSLAQVRAEPVKKRAAKVKRHFLRRHRGDHDEASMIQVPEGIYDLEEDDELEGSCGVEGGECANFETEDDSALLQVAGGKAGASRTRGVFTVREGDYSIKKTDAGEIYELHVELPQHGVVDQWPDALRLFVPHATDLPTPKGFIEANSIQPKSLVYEGSTLEGYLVTYTDGARCLDVDPYTYSNSLCQDWFLLAPEPTLPVPPTTPQPMPGPMPGPMPAPNVAPDEKGRCCFHMSACPAELTAYNEVAGCVPLSNYCSVSEHRCVTPQDLPEGCDGTNTGTANVWCKV